MPLSRASRQAQSKLANAVKAGAPEASLHRLRTEFAVERAKDALRAVPGQLDASEQATLHAVVDALPRQEPGGEQP